MFLAGATLFTIYAHTLVESPQMQFHIWEHGAEPRGGGCDPLHACGGRPRASVLLIMRRAVLPYGEAKRPGGATESPVSDK